jgi:hypothetical protein
VLVDVRSGVRSLTYWHRANRIPASRPALPGTDAINIHPLDALATSAAQTMQNQQVQIHTLGNALQQTTSNSV